MGADTESEHSGAGSSAENGLLQPLQRGVFLEPLGESGSAFRAEFVFRETASMGAGVGAEGCQWALTEKNGVAYLRLRRDVAAGSMRPSSVTAVTPILDPRG